MTFPLLTPVIELTEALIAEKYLLGAVKECQMGLINGENYPSYTLPPQSVGLDVISTRRWENRCIRSEHFNYYEKLIAILIL